MLTFQNISYLYSQYWQTNSEHVHSAHIMSFIWSITILLFQNCILEFFPVNNIIIDILDTFLPEMYFLLLIAFNHHNLVASWVGMQNIWKGSWHGQSWCFCLCLLHFSIFHLHNFLWLLLQPNTTQCLSPPFSFGIPLCFFPRSAPFR